MTYAIHVKLNKTQRKQLASAKEKTGCGLDVRRVQITDPSDETHEIRLNAVNRKRLLHHLGNGSKKISMKIHHRGGFLWGLLPAIGRIISSVAPKVLAKAPSLLKAGAKSLGKLAVSAGTTALIDNMMKPKEVVAPPPQLPTQPEEPVRQAASGMRRSRKGRGIESHETLFDIGKNEFTQSKESFKKKNSEALTKIKKQQAQAEIPAVAKSALVNRQYLRKRPKSVKEVWESQHRVNALMQ